MAITATYISATEFSVPGDRTPYLKKGLAIQLIQGVDGTAESAVLSSSYNPATDITTCTVAEAVISVNLATIKTGRTYRSVRRRVHTCCGDDRRADTKGGQYTTSSSR